MQRVIIMKKIRLMLGMCGILIFIGLRLLWLMSNGEYDSHVAVNTLNLISSNEFYTEIKLPNVSKLSQRDLRKLLDIKDFTYTIDQPKCDDHVLVVIVVHSAPSNFEKRLFIRETWGSLAVQNGSPLRLVFLLGTVSNQLLQQKLLGENKVYCDLVQGNFVDDYKNMTYKHVMAFKWFLYNCPHAQMLLKADDDIIVNTPQLLRYIEEASHLQSEGQNPSHAYMLAQLLHHPRNLLFCQKQEWSRVKRSYRSKWHVSVQEYAGRYYPPYCHGYSIIYSPDVVWCLYNAAQNYKYFWIDDVHVTGTLAQLCNITITSSAPYTFFRYKYGSEPIGKLDCLFVWPEFKEQHMLIIWQLFSQQNIDITGKRAGA